MRSMNRRGFIHSILGCLALPFLPKSTKAKKPKPLKFSFDPNKPYSIYRFVGEEAWSELGIKFAISELQKILDDHIPPEYRTPLHIRWIFHSPGPCGTGFLDAKGSFAGSVAWLYIPFKEIEPKDKEEIFWDPIRKSS